MGWRGIWRRVVMVKKAKRASRMSRDGLGLGWVRKNKMILSVLHIERAETARTCSSWCEAGCGDEG
jgi:hypothetical protein